MTKLSKNDTLVDKQLYTAEPTDCISYSWPKEPDVVYLRQNISLSLQHYLVIVCNAFSLNKITSKLVNFPKNEKILSTFQYFDVKTEYASYLLFCLFLLYKWIIQTI